MTEDELNKRINETGCEINTLKKTVAELQHCLDCMLAELAGKQC